jgi:ABC-2 type transport system permease protein
MATYLLLINKLIHQNKWKLVFTIFFPFFLLFVLLPLFSKTIEESQVPIALVNGEQSEFAQIVTERVSDHPRIQLLQMNKEEATSAVITGKVEAAFFLDTQFEEHIKNGEMEEQITWLRSEHSFLDAFVKEKLAAEVMRLTLNSKAANDIKDLTGQNSMEEWERSFDHSDAYWEPEPLFQMEFLPYSKSTSITTDDTELNRITIGLVGFSLFYIWLAFAASLLPLYTWREKGIIVRIQIVRGTLVRFFSSFFVLNILFFICLFSLIIFAIDRFDLLGNYSLVESLLSGVSIVMIIFILTIAMQLLIRNKNYFLLVVTVFSLCSFSFSILAVFSEAASWWYDLLPHVWLYQSFM